MSKKRIAIAALVIVILIAASLTVYGIDEGFGGLAIWNQSEAYLFFQVGSRGNHASYLRGIPWILFKEHVIGAWLRRCGDPR